MIYNTDNINYNITNLVNHVLICSDIKNFSASHFYYTFILLRRNVIFWYMASYMLHRYKWK